LDTSRRPADLGGAAQRRWLLPTSRARARVAAGPRRRSSMA